MGIVQDEVGPESERVVSVALQDWLLLTRAAQLDRCGGILMDVYQAMLHCTRHCSKCSQFTFVRLCRKRRWLSTYFPSQCFRHCQVLGWRLTIFACALATN